MWTRDFNIWVYKELPFITVEPCTIGGHVQGWQACCGGRPIPHIAPGYNSHDVMQQAEKYFDERIEMTSLKGEWRR